MELTHEAVMALHGEWPVSTNDTQVSRPSSTVIDELVEAGYAEMHPTQMSGTYWTLTEAGVRQRKLEGR